MVKRKKKEVAEDVQLLLKSIVDDFDKEDFSVRERQIRLWKRLKYYWDGFSDVWWSTTAHDWRIGSTYTQDTENDSSHYDKPVNVFRAYLESIIAALSVTVPSIDCFPDDAENALDLATAKAGDKIAELIYKHNDVILLWLHALYIYCTEGMVACYNYTDEDERYGTYEDKKYEESEDSVDVNTCPTCGNEIPEAMKQELDAEYDPEEVVLQDLLQNENFCPYCMEEVMPIVQAKKVIVTRMVGKTNKPKSRQCMEVYGGLYIKVPNYALDQKTCPYLQFCKEVHYTLAIEEFPHLRDKFTKQTKISPTGGAGENYERWGRVSTQYAGDYPRDVVTIKRIWLRPATYNILSSDVDIKRLKKLYPNGCCVVFVDDVFACAEDESLDDHWTLTKNPLADHVHHDPLGLLLTSVQDITNEIIALTLQTIEHGVPQTFADPAVLNFNAYGKSEVAPGSIYPAKPATGKSVGDAFYEVRTATLSGEVLPFGEKIQELGQLTTGALPSLFGGAAPGGGKTAAQYSMSRSMALQRLQTPWKMLTVWWKTIFGKVIPAYIKEVKDDERSVTKDPSGNFVNTYIRRAELEGKIGSVELEASEQLPLTWAQRKDVIMQLMSASNPVIMQALTAPENLAILGQAIGLDDFFLPGESDRDKQFEEIKILLSSSPIPDPATGTEGPSVPIEPLVDNHQVEAEICRMFLVGPGGRLAKIENPDGYRNVLLHLQLHMQQIQPPAAPAPNDKAAGKPMAAKPPNLPAAA